MLNYVWILLISIGIISAIVRDSADIFSNKYSNGVPLKVLIEEDRVSASGEKVVDTFQMKIPPEEFQRVYGHSLEDTLRTDLKFLAALSDTLIKVKVHCEEGYPPIWIAMAKANGDETDIEGTLHINSVEPGNFRHGLLYLENIKFVMVKEVTNAILDYSSLAVQIVLGLIGIMAMWLGIMKIAEEAGIINYIAILARPLTKFLFPEIPRDHPAIGSIIMNISATFLGLGNAATPFGIKAMEDLNKLNPSKDTATNAMCTFLVINTASFALMPTTAIALRASAGSSQPAVIIGTTMFGSFCATVVGIFVTKVFENFPLNSSGVFSFIKNRIRLFSIFMSIIIGLWLLSFTDFYGMIFHVIGFLNPDLLRSLIEIISTIAIPSIILTFVLIGISKKVKIYEVFVEGAKEGFKIAITIIPYLVAILMAIGIFRAGGGMEYFTYILQPVTDFIGMPSEALPMALMRPLSGSGSLGIMAEIISVHGADSFLGILVSTMFGSTETTFYVLAVYFGAVNITKTRHALPAGLISDVAGILAALFIVKLLYG